MPPKRFALPRLYTLDIYLLKHFLPTLAVAIGFFTFIVLVFFLKETIKHAVEKNLEVGVILQLCWYALGWTLTLTVPMAVLLSTILTVGNLNSDSEIIAMRAGGITYFRIMRPFLGIVILLAIFLSWFSNNIVPTFFDNMENMRVYILSTDPIAIIEPGQFTTLDKKEGMVRKIYIETVEKNPTTSVETLKNIQVRKIMGRQLAELIIAKQGKKVLKQTSNGDWVKALRLSEGYVFVSDASGTFQRFDFSTGTFDINIQEPEKIKRLKKIQDFNSMTLGQILDSTDLILKEKDPAMLFRKASLEIHKRFALAFSAIAFMLVGFPVAVVNRRSGKGMGLGISVLFIFAYFTIFLSIDSLSGEANIIPAAVAGWLANVLILAFAAYFSVKRLKNA